MAVSAYLFCLLYTFIHTYFKRVVLNLWVKTALGIKRPYQRSCLKLSGNTDIYATIHSNDKITVKELQ